jgi:hypothetical protein
VGSEDEKHGEESASGDAEGLRMVVELGPGGLILCFERSVFRARVSEGAWVCGWFGKWDIV